jgi:hypothetical protein
MIWTLIILNLVTIVIWIVSFGLQIIICYACITLEIILVAKILNIQGIPCHFFQNAILKNSVLLARYNLYSVSRRATLF